MVNISRRRLIKIGSSFFGVAVLSGVSGCSGSWTNSSIDLLREHFGDYVADHPTTKSILSDFENKITKNRKIKPWMYDYLYGLGVSGFPIFKSRVEYNNSVMLDFFIRSSNVMQVVHSGAGEKTDFYYLGPSDKGACANGVSNRFLTPEIEKKLI